MLTNFSINMSSPAALVICALVATVSCNNILPREISKQGPQYMFDYVRSVQDTLPAIRSSSDCFSYYMPILEELANTTNEKSLECNNTAARSFVDSMEIVQTENGNLTTDVGTAIAGLQSCGSESDPIKQLECYSTLNQDPVHQIQQLANNASIALRAYNQNVTSINNELLTCNTKVSAESQVETETYYSDLIYCMNNNALPTTTTVAINTKPTTVSTIQEETTARTGN